MTLFLSANNFNNKSRKLPYKSILLIIQTTSLFKIANGNFRIIQLLINQNLASQP